MFRKMLIVCIIFAFSIPPILQAPASALAAKEDNILNVNTISARLEVLLSGRIRLDMWRFIWPDYDYRKMSLAEFDSVSAGAVRQAKALPWNGEAGDCDDAAVIAKAYLCRYAAVRSWRPIPCGMVSLAHDYGDSPHAMIWFMDDQLDLYFLEPRSGDITPLDAMPPGLIIFWMMG